MNKKIVIVTSFCESHLLNLWLENVYDTINPDHIIINHGLFPNGPENKGHVGNEFISKWKNLIDSECSIYEQVAKSDSRIRVNFLNYEQLNISDANSAFLYSSSNFGDIDVINGDYLFPLEIDCFTLQSDKDKLIDCLAQTQIGVGFKTQWIDFLETQYYTEAINIIQPKYRRFCYRFDNLQNYLSAIDGFMSQSYTKLFLCNKFVSFHYPWFKPIPFKELRYELIWRSDPQYWKDFEIGLQEIRDRSEKYDRLIKTETMIWEYQHRINYPPSKITIRPSRSDEGRYAQFIDIKHPKHIENHPNFVK